MIINLPNALCASKKTEGVMKKKVLFFRSAPNEEDLNGYNVQGIGIAKAFCRLGYDCDYVTFSKKKKSEKVFYEYNGCRGKLITKPRFRVLRMGINLDVLKEDFLKQYDIIISREYYQIMTYLLSKKSDRVSMYSGPYYNMFMFKFFSPIYDALFTKKMNRNIKCKFVKSVLAKEFTERKGYTDVYNVGVGLDVERFINEHEIKPETQKIVDYMKKNRCILYVGALSDRKNYPFLLEVYKKILEVAPDVKFVVIGKSKQSTFAKLIGMKDESYADKYYSRLPQKVKDGIYHVNRVENPQLKFIYPLAKAFLLPSKLEIFGMVLLEAMYLGAPVVSSRNGGSLTLMGDGKTGQIVEQFDAELWKNAVLKYLNDPYYTKRVIDATHKQIKDEYTWDAIAQRMLSHVNGEVEEN